MEQLNSIEQEIRKSSNNINQIVHRIHQLKYQEVPPAVKEEIKAIDLGRKFMMLRFPHEVGIVKPHFDQDPIHLHVVYSPNNKGNNTFVRMSKSEFMQVRRDPEEYQREHYPSLPNSYVHSRDIIGPNKKRRETKISLMRIGKSCKPKLKNQLRTAAHLRRLRRGSYPKNYNLTIEKKFCSEFIQKGKKYRLTTIVRNNEPLKKSLQLLQKKEREKCREIQ